MIRAGIPFGILFWGMGEGCSNCLEFTVSWFRTPVKEEDGSQETLAPPIWGQVEEVPIPQVLCLQSRISATLRNGMRLDDLIQRLQQGEVHPNREPWLVLKMSKATWRDRHGRQITQYYTFDHRRLYCIWKAGYRRVRAEIVLAGAAFNEFARKADRLGTALEPLMLFGVHLCSLYFVFLYMCMYTYVRYICGDVHL